MEVAEMRRLLNEAKSSGKSLGCAVGLSKDMKTGLLLMHKTHLGPEVGRALKAETPDVVNMRFGSAIVDPDDPKLVRLVLNRPVTGIAKKLIKTLKGTGYTKVKLGLEDGTPVEGAEEEEEGQQPAQTATPQQAEAQDADAPPPPPPPPPQAPDPARIAELTKQLTALAGRIQGVAGENAALRAALLKLAAEAQNNLKHANIDYAVISISQLQRALDNPGGFMAASAPAAQDVAGGLTKVLTTLAGQIPKAAGDDTARRAELLGMAQDASGRIKANDLAGAGAVIAKLRDALEGRAAKPVDTELYRNVGREWLATRQHVEDELERLRAAIAAEYKELPELPVIEQNFRSRIAPILQNLDTSLATSLESASKEADAGKRQILIDEAKTSLNRFSGFVQQPLLGEFDDNPFLPLSLRASVTKTLSELAVALR